MWAAAMAMNNIVLKMTHESWDTTYTSLWRGQTGKVGTNKLPSIIISMKNKRHLKLQQVRSSRLNITVTSWPYFEVKLRKKLPIVTLR